jgi:hypothetical protein
LVRSPPLLLTFCPIRGIIHIIRLVNSARPVSCTLLPNQAPCGTGNTIHPATKQLGVVDPTIRKDSSMKNEPTGNGATRSADELPETLVDRVQVRVTNAALALDRRANATRPKSHRARVRPASVSAANGKSPEAERAEQSLRQVFRELGVSYRRYRKQTGTPVMPALRDAAYNFRAEPSLTTLVAVAAYLDELDLLR